MNAIARLLCMLNTVPLARLNKQLQAELARRAEYAARFGIQAPSQFSVRAILQHFAAILHR